MAQRIEYEKLASKPYKALLAVAEAIEQSGLEQILLHLLNLRVSQINGCAFCISLHTNELMALKESEDRIHLLSVWKEVKLYSERERAALSWAETITRITEGHAPQAAYEAVLEQFSEAEVANMTIAISLMNAFNRLAISLRKEPLAIPYPALIKQIQQRQMQASV